MDINERERIRNLHFVFYRHEGMGKSMRGRSEREAVPRDNVTIIALQYYCLAIIPAEYWAGWRKEMA